MRKIPTLFIRNPEKMSEVLPSVHPDCQWVLDGEGTATLKTDGTCCQVSDGRLYKRREVRKGKTPPEGFIGADFDPNTGKRVGWLLVDLESKEDRWHVEAWGAAHRTLPVPDGTYELLGPKIQGNPEGRTTHVLEPHGIWEVVAPVRFDELHVWLAKRDIEGIVWHHPDGRMAKIKKKDFGLPRTPTSGDDSGE